jgi:hypothetical protein
VVAREVALVVVGLVVVDRAMVGLWVAKTGREGGVAVVRLGIACPHTAFHL